MSMNILLVDDEPKVLRGLKMIIERAGKQWAIAGECTNGQEALDFIKKEPGLIKNHDSWVLIFSYFTLFSNLNIRNKPYIKITAGEVFRR